MSESLSVSEKDTTGNGETGDEIAHPPARRLGADAMRSTHQTRPHIDDTEAFADALLVVPVSFSVKGDGKCHRGVSTENSGIETACGQAGTYTSWSVTEVELHGSITTCDMCFPTSWTTLTPEGDYTPPAPRMQQCDCGDRIPLNRWPHHVHDCEIAVGNNHSASAFVGD